ncbi:hypothetical protein QOT17_003459 [Balamuthia mandrillaris]
MQKGLAPTASPFEFPSDGDTCDFTAIDVVAVLRSKIKKKQENKRKRLTLSEDAWPENKNNQRKKNKQSIIQEQAEDYQKTDSPIVQQKSRPQGKTQGISRKGAQTTREEEAKMREIVLKIKEDNARLKLSIARLERMSNQLTKKIAKHKQFATKCTQHK